jgi:5'-3' exonuclease
LITKQSKMIDINTNAPILLIDGSYFIFYRYYAILGWWNKQKDVSTKTKILDEDAFKEKYEKLFVSTLNNLCKAYEVPWNNVVFASDCPREDIWRFEHCASYKGTRDGARVDNFDERVFPLSYEILSKMECQVVRIPRLEADDVIALMTRRILEVNPEADVTIITNDNDYIQLYHPDRNVVIVNLQGAQLKDRVVVDEITKYLTYKIIIGDKSDNIPAICAKCGPKTALKLTNSPEELERLFKKDPNSKIRFDENKTLIDFNSIPSMYVAQLQEKLKLYKDIA